MTMIMKLDRLILFPLLTCGEVNIEKVPDGKNQIYLDS